MDKIDIINNKVVGIVERQMGSNHCSINVVGYLDQQWSFHPLNSRESIVLFPSRGKVFAPNFIQYYSNLVGKCIYAGMMYSKNDGRDYLVWDRNNGLPEEYGTTIINAGGIFTDKSSENSIYNVLKEKGFIDIKKGKKYLKVGKFIYVIEPNILKDYFVYQYDFSSAKLNSTIVGADNNLYLIGELKGTPRTIDVMPDSILIDWLIKNFMCKEWAKIQEATSPDVVSSELKTLMINSKSNKSILSDKRKERIQKLLSSYIFNYREMMSLSQLPILKESLDQSVQKHCQDFIFKANLGFREELEKQKKKYEDEIENERQKASETIKKIKEEVEFAELDAQIEIEKLESKKKSAEEKCREKEGQIEEFDNLISERQNRLSDLDEKKDEIIKGFGVIKDVIQMMGNHSTASSSITNQLNISSADVSIDSINDEEEEIKQPFDFEKRLAFFLMENNRSPEISKKILGYLVHYKCILVPDNRIILSILKATGKCKFNIQYVNPDWQSFAHVWTNGLDAIVNCAFEEKDIMHYYIIQNSNMSYLPCYLQPIMDMCIGMRNYFPNTTTSFPDNLRVLLTITSEEGLPLAKQSLKNIGCLTYKDYTIDINNENAISSKKPNIAGYISKSKLAEMAYTHIIDSDYLSYIKEDDE